jgi:hypothetical protein
MLADAQDGDEDPYEELKRAIMERIRTADRV